MFLFLNIYTISSLIFFFPNSLIYLFLTFSKFTASIFIDCHYMCICAGFKDILSVIFFLLSVLVNWPPRIFSFIPLYYICSIVPLCSTPPSLSLWPLFIFLISMVISYLKIWSWQSQMEKNVGHFYFWGTGFSINIIFSRSIYLLANSMTSFFFTAE